MAISLFIAYFRTFTPQTQRKRDSAIIFFTFYPQKQHNLLFSLQIFFLDLVAIGLYISSQEGGNTAPRKHGGKAMTTNEIKKMVEAIINDGSGIIYTDAGSGCGGPGYAGPDTLREMMENGDFDDAEVVEMDRALMADAYEANKADLDEETKWSQIEFNFVATNGYRQIAWIWEA